MTTARGTTKSAAKLLFLPLLLTFPSACGPTAPSHKPVDSGVEIDSAIDADIDAQVDARTDGAVDSAIDGGLADTPIQDLQDSTRTSFVPPGTRVRVANVVVTAKDSDSNVFFVQEPSGSPSYSGIFVFVDTLPAGSTAPNLGDLVEVTGTVLEYSRPTLAGSRTNIDQVTGITILGTSPVPQPVAVDETEIAPGGSRAEELEGVLVQIQGVTVGATEPTMGTFTVDGGVAVGDRLFSDTSPLDPPYVRDMYTSITGPLDFDFGAPRILPRSGSDLAAYIRAVPCMTGLSPTAVSVGEMQTVTLTAQIDRPAPVGGTALTLDTSNATVATPTTQTAIVAAGQNTAEFVVRGLIASASPVTVGASISTCSVGSVARKTALVSVLAGSAPRVSAITPATLAVMGGGGEGSLGILTVVLDRAAPASPATTVTLSGAVGSLALPASVVVPVGETQASFQLRGTGAASGTPATVTASFGGQSRNASVTLLSAALAPAAGDLAINEVFAAPGSTIASGDANCDGVANTTQDEFVELVSTAPHPIDISNVELNDSATTPNGHRFSAGTILGPGEVVIIFGGGSTVTANNSWCAGPGGTILGGARIVRANVRSTLGLNNSGDTLTLRSAAGATLAELTFSNATTGMSITRAPDVTGQFFKYSSAAGFATDRGFSPGTKLTGAAFWSARP